MDDYCIKYEKPLWVTWLRERICLSGMLPQVLGVGGVRVSSLTGCERQVQKQPLR